MSLGSILLSMKILVVDIGGTHVKVASSDHSVPLKIVSGAKMTAQIMVDQVRIATEGWEYDAISFGYPGPVGKDGPLAEPHNLAAGWVGFSYAKAFPGRLPVSQTSQSHCFSTVEGLGCLSADVTG